MLTKAREQVYRPFNETQGHFELTLPSLIANLTRSNSMLSATLESRSISASGGRTTLSVRFVRAAYLIYDVLHRVHHHVGSLLHVVVGVHYDLLPAG